MKLMKQYSERSELVDFLDDADFNYQITIPCHHMNYTSDTYEKKIKEKDRHKQEQMFNNYGQ